MRACTDWGRHFELEREAGLGAHAGPKITRDPGAARNRKALMKKKKSFGRFDKTYEIRCKGVVYS